MFPPLQTTDKKVLCYEERNSLACTETILRRKGVWNVFRLDYLQAAINDIGCCVLKK